MDNCTGDFHPGAPTTIFAAAERGEFTKETMASAFREGWGNFVSTVAWNARVNEDDCEFQVQYKVHDFDSDGVIDSDRGGTTLDGAYDGEGIPTMTGDAALASYVTAENWLQDVEDGDDNNVDGLQCVRDASSTIEENRTTVFDVTRMLWDLTTEWDLTPGKLSSLYVDMCPRGWSQGDPASPDNSLPLDRLDLSATENTITSEVDAEVSHVEH